MKLLRFAIAFVLLGASSSVSAQGWTAGFTTGTRNLRISPQIGRSDAVSSLLTYTGDDVDLSMVLRRQFESRGKFTPFVLSGPSVTIHAGCSTQLDAGTIGEFDCEQTSLLSRIDYAFVAGYGVSRMLGSTTLSVEARASADLREVAHYDRRSFGRVVGWSLMVGASMPLRRALADSVTCSGRAPCQRQQ